MLDCWERGRNYPPEFFCQIHGDNSSHDAFDCIVLRKEFVMLHPEFMEYRRRRLGAAARIGGRGSGRGMDDPHRQQPRLDSGASWSRGRPPPPPQRAGSGPGGHNGRHPGGDVARTIDFINHAEGAAEAVTTTKGTLPPIPTPTSNATTVSRTTPHRSSSSSSSSSSDTVHHLPLLPVSYTHLTLPTKA